MDTQDASTSGHVTSRAELLAGGVTRSMLRRHLRAKRWRQVGPRAIVLHNGPLSWEDRLRVALITTGASAALAGLTAAQAAGLRGFDDSTIHVCVPKGAHVVHMPGVVVHVLRRMRADDVLPNSSPRRTRTPIAVIDAALWSRSHRAAMTYVAAAVQQRLVTVAQLREAMDRVRRHKHRKVILLALGDVEMGAQSLSEIDFARLCRAAGLPEPDRQVIRTDPDGKRRYLDAEWDAARLVVEVDGAHHADVAQWDADLDRQNEEVIGDKCVLRFSSITVRTNEKRVVSQLARAMRRAS